MDKPVLHARDIITMSTSKWQQDIWLENMRVNGCATTSERIEAVRRMFYRNGLSEDQFRTICRIGFTIPFDMYMVSGRLQTFDCKDCVANVTPFSELQRTACRIRREDA